MTEFDGIELIRWAEMYGHPEEWAKRAQAAHARAGRYWAALNRIATNDLPRVHLGERGQAHYHRPMDAAEFARSILGVSS